MHSEDLNYLWKFNLEFTFGSVSFIAISKKWVSIFWCDFRYLPLLYGL